MSEQAILYGYIEGAFGSSSSGEAWRALYRLNQEAIARLPAKDEYPPLTRGMFGAPMADAPGFYRVQVIHFGASFNHFTEAWPDWLAKFEELLRRLYWFEARLHLVMELYGEYTYRWSATDLERLRLPGPLPTSRWTFTGGPRSFEG